MAKIPEDDLYAIQFEECYTLYQQEKFTECIAAAKFNMTDPTLPPYILMKTLILIANAEDDWEAAEECRLEAERLYQVIKERISRQPQDSSDEEKEAMQELRNSLEITLASQVEDAPDYVRMRFSCWPPREGNIEDAIGALGRKADNDKELEDDDLLEEQLEDDEALAAVERAMDSELMSGDMQTTAEQDHDLQGDKGVSQEATGQGALKSIAMRPKEDAKTKSKPEGSAAVGSAAEGSAAGKETKSPTLARKKSKRELKQPTGPAPRWRF